MENSNLKVTGRLFANGFSNWNPWRISVGAMMIGVAMYFIVPLASMQIPDAAEYLRVGSTFFETGFFSSDKMMPLYPLLAALSVKLGWPPFINIVLSGLTCVILYHLALALRQNKQVAVISAISMALFPFPVFYAISGLSETSFVFFVLAAFLCLYKNRVWAASFFMVAAILVRPAFDLLNPILIVAFAYFVHRKRSSAVLLDLGKYVIAYVLMMTPWWCLNSQRYGQFVRLNLGSGEMIYGGNSPQNITGRSNPEELDFSEFSSISDPVLRNDQMMSRAWDSIKADVPFFLRKCVRRFIAFWNIVPNHEGYRSNGIMVLVGMFSLYLIAGGLSFIYFTEGGLRFFLPIIICFLYLTLVHTITIGSLRYRYPLEPFLMIIAASGFSRLLEPSKSRTA